MKLTGAVIRNSRGQATMEAVLLMIVFTIIAMKISNVAQSRGFMRSVVEGPWAPMRGMIEDGVWVRYTESKAYHPNHRIRHQSKKGDST